jgi:hypothetical protein
MMYSDDINITRYILNNPQIYKTLLKSITLEERDFFGRFAMVWHTLPVNSQNASRNVADKARIKVTKTWDESDQIWRYSFFREWGRRGPSFCGRSLR